MARPITTKVDVIPGVNIVNKIKDGQREVTTLYKEDSVSDLSFEKNGETKTISGRIADVVIYFKKTFGYMVSTMYDVMQSGSSVAKLLIDSSKANEMEITNVMEGNLLPYQHTADSIVEEVYVEPLVRVSMEVELSDGTKNQFILNRYQTYNFTLMGKDGNEETIEGKVIGFIYNVTTDPNKATFQGVAVRSDDKTEQIQFMRILNAEEKMG